MAYVPFAAALRAAREALEAAHGSLRTIPAGRLTDALHEGASEDELARRGALEAKPSRVELAGMRPHPASPPIIGSVLIYETDWEVTISRTVSPEQQVDADSMSELRALAWEDADVIRQALCTPPNLATTSTGTASGLCGDALVYVGTSAVLRTSQPPGKAQRYETIHRFTAAMKSIPSAA